jgi:DNA polymerase III sliding clamp (beta) subunit (PCNA family)
VRLEAVTITLQGGVAHASYGRVELSMRLVEGEFPDYKQVIPQKSERRMLVGIEALLSGSIGQAGLAQGVQVVHEV